MTIGRAVPAANVFPKGGRGCALPRAAGIVALAICLAAPVRAARFIAVPFAETMDKGRYSVWQFGLYEERGPKTWRHLSRLDLGAWDGVELGVLAISPEGQPASTWVNVQARPIKEEGWRPSVSVGVWDLFQKASPWFKARAVAPSPFMAVSKGHKWGKRYVKGGVNYGFGRLQGWSGGADLRFLPGTGAMAEYSPRNLRLAGAAEIDFGVYQWLGKYFRVRASSVGGNPMMDAFFTYAFAGP